MNYEELRFSFNVSSQTATLSNGKTGEELLTLNKEQALWLAERVMKNFEFKLI